MQARSPDVILGWGEVSLGVGGWQDPTLEGQPSFPPSFPCLGRSWGKMPRLPPWLHTWKGEVQKLSEMAGMLPSDGQRSHDEGCMHVARMSYLGSEVSWWGGGGGAKIQFRRGSYLVRPIFVLLKGEIQYLEGVVEGRGEG